MKAFREGSCYVQDESSMLCAKLASVQKEQFVMDLCSAPGGKSLYVADQLKGSGRVLSRDLTEYKTDLIEDNIDRVGFTNMESEVFDARVLDEEHIEAADVVIADVPCSGLGIMGKKNDIKYHISEEGMKDLVKLQREILANAVQYVKHGGTLIYSTCTVNPAENEENFRWILDHFDFEAVDITKELPKDLKIETAQEGFIQLLPGIHPCDGFFIGKLRRNKVMDLKSMTLQEMQEYMESIGEKKFRAKQIYEWFHKHLALSLDEMNNIPKKLKEKNRADTGCLWSQTSRLFYIKD